VMRNKAIRFTAYGILNIYSQYPQYQPVRFAGLSCKSSKKFWVSLFRT
jgi:hypothetical protein